jgi:hypothetical protein
MGHPWRADNERVLAEIISRDKSTVTNIVICKGKVNRHGYETTCNKRAEVFAGDVWTCLNCGEVHRIPDKERKNGSMPIYVPHNASGQHIGH